MQAAAALRSPRALPPHGLIASRPPLVTHALRPHPVPVAPSPDPPCPASTFAQPADLAGAAIGVCAGCTYEAYLDGSLAIPGETIDFVVANAAVSGYETDVPALEDLALGDGVRLAAVLTALPTGLGYIADGGPLKQLGEPVYFEYLAAAIDKSAPQDTATLRAAVTEAIQALHAEGTLAKLSEKYYGTDLTGAAATFDLSQLDH